MAWQVDQLKYAFGLGGLFSFYGIVGMLVWLVGDQYGYGWTERIIIILLVLITFADCSRDRFYCLAPPKEKGKASRSASQAQEKTPETEAAKTAATPTGNNDDLAKGAEETVQFLKSSNLGEGGKDAVYSLPWYLVMGTPKSGKSSLVLGSNLDFQTLPSQRQTELKFLRPTRNVDWRVTSEAVFLDTAGRFQTEGVDGDEWNSLLETIKKYRPNRPLDGVLMTVSAERILHSDEREIEEQAKILRTTIGRSQPASENPFSRLSGFFTRRRDRRFPRFIFQFQTGRQNFSLGRDDSAGKIGQRPIAVRRRIRTSAKFDNETPSDAFERAISACQTTENF